jgi:hypothetical protein
MKDKKQDAVEQQHSELGEPEVVTEVDDVGVTGSNIDSLREAHLKQYQAREAADFQRAGEIALTRLHRLEETGFSDSRGPLDHMATADAIGESVPYDHYQHLGQQTEHESGGPVSQNEHPKKHTIEREGK